MIAVFVVHVALLAAALLLKFFPPKKRNYRYGYRSPAALSNDKTFAYANKLAPNVFICVVPLSLLFNVMLFQVIPLSLGTFSYVLLAALPFVLCVGVIEYRLHKKY